MKAMWVGAGVLLLMASGTAGASKKCGNSYIADNKVCRIGTSTPYTPPAPAPKAAPVVAAPRFASCSQAREAGWNNIPSYSPSYSKDLDRDLDGIACEISGDDDAPSPAAPKATITPAPTTPAAPPKPAAPPTTTNTPTSPASTLTIYEVKGVPYVVIEDFAKEYGYSYRNSYGEISVNSQNKTMILSAGSVNAYVDGKITVLLAPMLSIGNQPAVFFADLLKAFGLNAQGKTFKTVVYNLPGTN